MAEQKDLTVSDWRDLYEGMTQKDPIFREKLQERHPEVSADRLISELELAQNRLTYAMMGIHPIYEREIELSGFVDYGKRQMLLYADSGERIVPFGELDPSYVEFLENQKRFHSVKDVQPLSSVAIQASRELYPETKETFESIPMNTDGVQKEKSTDVLKLAWDRSTILMNHLQEEMEKSGVMTAYGVDRDELRVYCSSYMGNAQFDYSVRELKNVAEESRAMNDMDEALL